MDHIEREHPANSLIRDLVQLHDELVDKLREEAGDTIGFSEVTTRYARGLVRKAVQGDNEAYIELLWLESVQPSQASKEELYREIEAVLAKGQGVEPTATTESFGTVPEVSATGGPVDYKTYRLG